MAKKHLTKVRVDDIFEDSDLGELEIPWNGDLENFEEDKKEILKKIKSRFSHFVDVETIGTYDINDLYLFRPETKTERAERLEKEEKNRLKEIENKKNKLKKMKKDIIDLEEELKGVV
jgi:hypothetical protein